MSARVPSAFDRWGVDPAGGPAELTERMRELAEDARDAAERAAIRADWEALTLHPKRRLDEALETFPETRAPLGAPPPRRSGAAALDAPLDLRDLVAAPRLASALPAPDEAERAILGPPRAASVAGG